MKKVNKFPKSPNEKLEKVDGYPKYPEREDVYNKFNKEFDIDPDNLAKNKTILPLEKNGTWNEKNFNQDPSGNDLDVPGTELDDAQENIGSEDEENNLFSNAEKD